MEVVSKERTERIVKQLKQRMVLKTGKRVRKSGQKCPDFFVKEIETQ